MATKKKTPVTVEKSVDKDGRFFDVATGSVISGPHVDVTTGRTIVDPAFSIPVPRLHPADKMVIDRTLFPLKESMKPEDYEKLVADVSTRCSLDTLARSASTMALVDKDIRERYGNIEGNVTGLLRAILSELVMDRLNLR
jgi:hypothetical protein